MKIRLKNFVGISRAEIDVDSTGIALVGGDNAVGKSSVIRGVQILLTGELTPRGIGKTGSRALVMDGKKGGQLQLLNGEASVSVSYPDPQYVTQGEAPSASRLAAGLQRYTELSDGERSIFLTELLRAYPTLIQLNAALKDDLELPEDAVEQISMMVGSRGWDETVATLTEKRIKLKGQWEGITGERWGDRKAVEWRPKEWDESYSMDEATRERVDSKVNACQEAYDRASKANAISEAEHRTLKDLAGKREPAEMALDVAHQQLPSIEAAWAKLRRELDALPPPIDDEGIACPHCGAHVRVIMEAGTHTYRLAPVEPMTEGEPARRRRAIQDKREEVSEAHKRLEAHQQEIGSWEEKLRRAIEAAEKLKGVKVGNGNGKVEKLREQLEAAKHTQKLWHDLQAASELQLRVEAHQAVIDLLGPKGMRRTALLQALAAFERDSLDPLTGDMTTWKTLTIDRDTLLPLFGGRPYSLLSKSEQYRVDITMQIAIALLEGAAMICIDGADILSHNGQDDLLGGLLAGLPFPVIVGATYSRAKDCPNLDKFNAGHSYWIDAGKLMPLAEALA